MTDEPKSTELVTVPLDASELLPCALCQKGMMHGGDIHFYEVEIRQCIVDLPNVKRMQGMEMMMNGNVGLARVFSPDNTVAHLIGMKQRRLVCASCAMSQLYPVALLCEEST